MTAIGSPGGASPTAATSPSPPPSASWRVERGAEGLPRCLRALLLPSLVGAERARRHPAGFPSMRLSVGSSPEGQRGDQVVVGDRGDGERAVHPHDTVVAAGRRREDPCCSSPTTAPFSGRTSPNQTVVAKVAREVTELGSSSPHSPPTRPCSLTTEFPASSRTASSAHGYRPSALHDPERAEHPELDVGHRDPSRRGRAFHRRASACQRRATGRSDAATCDSNQKGHPHDHDRDPLGPTRRADAGPSRPTPTSGRSAPSKAGCSGRPPHRPRDRQGAGLRGHARGPRGAAPAPSLALGARSMSSAVR